jgi:AraC family ethanolamine operon transcriptional activator
VTKTVFRDFDEFSAAINGIAGQFVPTARSETDWWVHAVPVGRIAMQQVQVGSAGTFAGDGRPETITIGIPLGEPQEIRIDGQCMSESSFLRASEGRPFTWATQRATQWAGIEIPMDHELLDCELRDSVRSWTQSHSQTEKLAVETIHALLSRAFADDATVACADPAAERCLEEEAVLAISRALEGCSEAIETQIGRPRVPRDRIISKALEFMDASAGQPILVSELCRAAEVSERTLQYVFKEHFNVGPMRLLKVRQLREIRLALLDAEPGSETVAAIATRFGVWDFSLFARNYRGLYGEAPSATLRRTPPHRQKKDASDAWIRFAAQKFGGAPKALDEDSGEAARTRV